MHAVRATLEAVAPVDANVLLVGESGTGKELAARALHVRSPRAAHPFIAVNCAALPRDILENELFGHERGAFTGALRRKPGCFELADGGTLFLDEIGEMETDVQAKLLRVIEQQVYRRLGGKTDVTVDVRIVAATNMDVVAALESGALRSDLYYRLSVVEVRLPPLRERDEDVLLLAHHFLRTFADRHRREFTAFAPEALEALRAYAWPGNVRELRNAVERAVLLSPGPVVPFSALPDKVRGPRAACREVIIPLGSSVEEAERRLIIETLASVGNNKAKAARVLGVSRKTLHNKLNAFRDLRENGSRA
jgi:two-component system response regulator HydG